MPLPSIVYRHEDGTAEVVRAFGYEDFVGRVVSLGRAEGLYFFNKKSKMKRLAERLQRTSARTAVTQYGNNGCTSFGE
mgnify:CR=1 FL=1